MTETASTRGRAVRRALFFLLAPLAAALNGLMGYGILQAQGLLDFQRFYHAARAWRAGAPMYAPDPSFTSPVDHWLTLNPPHFLLAVIPLTSLSASVASGFWTVAGLVAAAVALRIVLEETRWTVRPSSLVTAAIAMAAFAGTTSVLINGQVSLLLSLPTTLAWRAARQERWRAAGAWLGLCASIKLFFLIFVPYLLLRRHWQALGGFSLAAGAVWIAGLALFGMEAYAGWVGALGGIEWYTRPLNASIYGLVSRNLPEVAWTAAWLATGGVIGIVTLASARVAGEDRAWLLLILAAILISPLGWIEYLLIGVGPLLAWLGSPVRVPSSALAAAALLMWPIGLLALGEGEAWVTLTLRSTYSWGVLVLWLGIVRQADWSSRPDPSFREERLRR